MTIDRQVVPEFKVCNDSRLGYVQFLPTSISVWPSLSGRRSAKILVWTFCTSMVEVDLEKIQKVRLSKLLLLMM